VLIAAFLVLNVLIGIVLNSMEEAREIERRRALGADVDDEISPHRSSSESPCCARR
jgi:hypothetical protein